MRALPATTEGADEMVTDVSGHAIDPTVGYARGAVLASSTDELRRYLHAQDRIRRRLSTAGRESIQVFTGNSRGFPLQAGDLGSAVEEWQGPSQFLDELRMQALEHLGGRPEHGVAAFNRTSAAIVAALSLLGRRGVASFAPARGGAHPSVRRGASLSTTNLVEVHRVEEVRPLLDAGRVGLLVVTPVNSDLQHLDNDALLQACAQARRAGVPVLLDDAYGARVRPILLEGPLSLVTGADLVVTNADKAGLPGPRAGVMAGQVELLRLVQGRAAEWGMEARAPIALAILRSLQAYSPQDVLDEVEAGQLLYDALVEEFGSHRVLLSPLGPVMSEDDVWQLAAEACPGDLVLVPCEVTAAIGQLLLDEGILTVNACGQPGSRVSVRLKTSGAELARAGGAATVVRKLRAALVEVATTIGSDVDAARRVILGGA
jgi:L-seryl-tRNA(Ser) seleniumtransferase